MSPLQWKRNLSQPPLVVTEVEKVIGVEREKLKKKNEQIKK
jgi:hypothetical protein